MTERRAREAARGRGAGRSVRRRVLDGRPLHAGTRSSTGWLAETGGKITYLTDGVIYPATGATPVADRPAAAIPAHPTRCAECPAFGCGVCHRTVLGFCPGCGLAQRSDRTWKHADWCVVRRLDASDRLPDLFAIVGPLSDRPTGVLVERDPQLTIEQWARLTDRLRDTPGFWSVHIGDGAQVVPYIDHERPDPPDPLYRHRA